MTLLDRVRYHALVTVAGRAALRAERWRESLQARRRRADQRSRLAPPLRTTPWLRELIARHYLAGRYAHLGRKVAWVTSGAPVEPLVALGYTLIYPENHGAVCGIRRVAERLCGHAEAAGFSQDICSYARTDIGSVLSGETPVGRLPPPDLLFCCTNICQTVLYWYRVLAHHFGVPMVVIDTPFLYREASDHALRYVERQLTAAVEVAERVAGRALDHRRLEQTTRYAKLGCELWLEIIETGRARPAPLSAFDEFIHLAPIVEMRGLPTTVDYYAALLAELEERVRRGEGAVVHERRRLLWDNLPIWYRVRWLSELLADHATALVASTYANAWGELAPLIDPADPIRSGARVYLHPILNRGTGHKLTTMRAMVRDYHADGVILHSDRSCKPYSVGQIDQRERLTADIGVPALLLEADHNDPRAFAEEPVASRLSAFLEQIGAPDAFAGEGR